MKIIPWTKTCFSSAEIQGIRSVSGNLVIVQDGVTTLDSKVFWWSRCGGEADKTG